MKFFWKFIQNCFWILFIVASFFLLAGMLYPLVVSILNTLFNESPKMVQTVQFSLALFALLWGIYLKKLRNDDRRREYLIGNRRIYPGFWKDLITIAKTKDFLVFISALVYLLLVFLFFFCDPSWFSLPPLVWRSLFFLGGFLGFSIGYLLMENKVHTYWIGLLQVPEESEAEVAWRRFNNHHLRLYIWQYVFTASIFICYFMNPYFSILPTCFTPTLVVQLQIQGYIAIKERKDRNKPVKKYVWLQITSLVAYCLAFLFGVFAPRIY